ncbi:uncharacterized protein LOC131995969 [Stomoxys calcitrans]|uniref:uncharacterized protein LOC131995969 n=1 Tax=Stomoxys calcitrans TaxID=35570 RepID=UPI0027E30047|nr:uncharacterized protein LOC131995969 [Stomoxys calcitrans]
MEHDLLKTISKEALRHTKKYVRIELRGKLSRTVPILLDSLCVEALDTILKLRSKAGVNESENKYVFSNPSASKTSKKYFRACALLKNYAEQCGADVPESLRGTKLRKHIATYMSVINAEDASVDKLANFMGHHKDVHKTHYRQQVPAAEIYCVSKILMAAMGDTIDNGVGLIDGVNRYFSNDIGDDVGNVECKEPEERSESAEEHPIDNVERGGSEREVEERWESGEEHHIQSDEKKIVFSDAESSGEDYEPKKKKEKYFTLWQDQKA